MHQLVLEHAVVDLERGRVLHSGGLDLRLTDLEVRLLSYLAARAGERVDRDELQREVWGNRTTLSTRAVDMAVSRLRRKVEPEPKPTVLLTTRGGGYRLVLPETPDRRDAALQLLDQLNGPHAGEAATQLRAVAEELATGTPYERALAAELQAAHELVEGTWDQRLAVLEAAIEELPPVADRLRLALGTALQNADPPRSQELLATAAASPDPALAAEAALFVVLGRHRLHGPQIAKAELGAIDLDGAADTTRHRVAALQAYVGHQTGDLDFEETVEALRISWSASMDAGDLRGGVRAGMWMARLQRNDGDLQGARGTRRRCLEQQQLLADRVFEGLLALEDGFDLAHSREFEASLARFDRSAEIFERSEPPRLRYVQMCRGLVLLQLRRHDEARRDLEDAAAWAHRAGRRFDEQHSRKTLALLFLDQGLAERAARVARRAVALGEQAGSQFALDTARMHLGAALHRMGDHRGAWDAYDAIDLDALTLDAKAAALARMVALAKESRPDDLARLCRRLSVLVAHATVPDAAEFQRLIDALEQDDADLVRPLIEGGASVEIRVAARLVDDALR